MFILNSTDIDHRNDENQNKNTINKIPQNTSKTSPTKGIFQCLIDPSIKLNTGINFFQPSHTTIPNLFNNHAINLFDNQTKISAERQHDEQDEDIDSKEDVVPNQQDISDPSKSTGSYNYGPKPDELFKAKASNFKVTSSNGPMGPGIVTIEKISSVQSLGTSHAYLVYRSQAGLLLFNGLIFPNRSQAGSLRKLEGCQIDVMNVSSKLIVNAKIIFYDCQSKDHFLDTCFSKLQIKQAVQFQDN